MWLNELKIAVVQRDAEAVEKLLDNLPKLEDPQEIDQAIHLLAEANKFITTLRDETQTSMQQIQKNIDFLRSGVADKTARFDITS